MLTKDEILAKLVFIQAGAQARKGCNKRLGDVLRMISCDELKETTESLRQLKLQNRLIEAGNLKKRLPAVAFAASYRNNRSSGNEDSYNALCIVDIDDLDLSKVKEMKAVLGADCHIFSVWISPSGRGLKALVPFAFEVSPELGILSSAHRAGFIGLSGYLLHTYGLKMDDSGKDIPRLCFLSHDPEIVTKEVVTPFEVTLADFTRADDKITVSRKIVLSKRPVVDQSLLRASWQNPFGKNAPADRRKLNSIMKYLSKRSLSITYTYDSWYHVAYALVNSFTYDLALRYFCRLSKMDPDKYKESTCKRMVEYCFQNSNNEVFFGTIVYYAQNVGYY